MEQIEQKNPKFQPFRRGKIRFAMLFFISMVVFGNQFAFNNPQALEVNMEKDLGIGETQFQLLYTIFAFPNIFTTFFIGFLIDYVGPRIGLICLTIGMVVFQSVIAIGGYTYNYTTILIGRMLFGIVGQSTITALSCFVALWFKGKELSMAFGIAVTFPEFGNALNSLVTPLIYQKTQSLGTPLLFSVFICLISFACALIAAYIDRYADQYDAQHKIVVQDSNEEEQAKETIKLKDLKKLTPTFWLLIVMCMFSVGNYVPFLDGANKFFVERFCYTPVTAGRALVVTYITSAILSTPLGLLIDYFGHKRYLITATLIVFTTAQLFFLLYPQCPEGGFTETGAIAGLTFLGLGYSLYGNCIVPSVSLVVKKKINGTAFGIMLMAESITFAFFPVINGALIEQGNKNPNYANGYHNSSLFFLSLGIIGCTLSMGLFFIPAKLKHKLDRSSIHNDKVEHGENGELIFITESESESAAEEKVKQTIEIVERSSDNLQANLLSTKQQNSDL